MADVDHTPQGASRPYGHPRTTESPSGAYRRQRPHLTQAPIDNVEPDYSTIERYTTLEQQRSGKRQHMGTATSDPEYLPQTDFQMRRDQRQNGGEGQMAPQRPRQEHAGSPKQSLHYERYLQTPKPGKSIFTSRQDRQRRRTHRVLAVLILLAVIVALVWFFVLR